MGHIPVSIRRSINVSTLRSFDLKLHLLSNPSWSFSHFYANEFVANIIVQQRRKRFELNGLHHHPSVNSVGEPKGENDLLKKG